MHIDVDWSDATPKSRTTIVRGFSTPNTLKAAKHASPVRPLHSRGGKRRWRATELTNDRRSISKAMRSESWSATPLILLREKVLARSTSSITPLVGATQTAATPTNRSEWDVICDIGESLLTRATALRALVLRHDSRLPAYIADALSSDDLDCRWQNELALATEWVKPIPSDLRPQFRESLKLHIRRTAALTDPHGAGSRWAALRRLASLLNRDRIEELCEFLSSHHQLDTRDVVLFRIRRILADRPPTSDLEFADMRLRVEELARKFTDPDVMTSPENLSLALNAIVAASSLGSPEIETLATAVGRSGSAAFKAVVRRQLQEQAAEWERRSPHSLNSRALHRTRQTILILSQD